VVGAILDLNVLFLGKAVDLPIRGRGFQAARCNLSGLGLAVAFSAPASQIEDHSPDSLGMGFRFDLEFLAMTTTQFPDGKRETEVIGQVPVRSGNRRSQNAAGKDTSKVQF